MQPARAVRTADERRLDVSRARGAGDEVDGARHRAARRALAPDRSLRPRLEPFPPRHRRHRKPRARSAAELRFRCLVNDPG